MTVDKVKVRQKLQFMRQRIRDLERFKGMELEEFKSDWMYSAAATRMLQVAIEALLDICAHITTREGWGLPKTYGEAVSIAVSNGLIPREMEDIFKDMARFRNRIVHIYDEVDDEEIWNIIRNNLQDFRPFITNVIERYLGEDQQ